MLYLCLLLHKKQTGTMNIIPTIFNLLALSFSLGTASSVLVHDTNIDKAMITALSSETANTSTGSAKPGNDPHTHSERMSLYQAIRSINSSQPKTQPRSQDDRRHVQEKPVTPGHHPFDNYSLPVIV